MSTSAPFVSGLIVAGYLVIALFFLKFWRQSRDRLFIFFSVAFWLLALQRALLTLLVLSDATTVVLYGLRALAFLMIVYAIVDKNRKA